MNHSNAARFDLQAFDAALHAGSLGRTVVYRAEVDSTMVVARREAEGGAAHGTLILAERQTAGRGRRGRSFYSPDAENLYFTFVLRCEREQHQRLPVVIPLAVCRACAAEGVEARIKWPNDIWAGERKLSGMLIDAELAGEQFLAFPGIGINVNGDPTVIPELRDSATSLQRELGRRVSREALLARICDEIECALRQPAARLVDAYRQLSMVLGRRVVVAPAAADAYEATAEAINVDGSLLVRRDGGAAETVVAADVSLRPAGIRG